MLLLRSTFSIAYRRALWVLRREYEKVGSGKHQRCRKDGADELHHIVGGVLFAVHGEINQCRCVKFQATTTRLTASIKVQDVDLSAER
jgi:NAD-dependent SIR2 family protein deacetylase